MMEHVTAEKTEAAERYLLDEFTPEECSEFEEHYFDCEICADRIRTGSVLIRTAREVLQGEAASAKGRAAAPVDRRQSFWRTWLNPIALAPSLVALGLLGVVGYQNLVTLPDLEKPQLLSSSVIAPAARAETQTVKIDAAQPRFNLNFMVDSPRLYPAYRCEFTNESGASVLTIGSGPRDVSSFTLSLLLPSTKFPSGRYTMTLRPQSDTNAIVQRYTFVLVR